MLLGFLNLVTLRKANAWISLQKVFFNQEPNKPPLDLLEFITDLLFELQEKPDSKVLSSFVLDLQATAQLL